jgi:hypothetical protein
MDSGRAKRQSGTAERKEKKNRIFDGRLPFEGAQVKFPVEKFRGRNAERETAIGNADAYAFTTSNYTVYDGSFRDR